MTCVMIVDAELSICETFQAFLKEDGYDTITAADFFEAESFLSERLCDVVVAGVALPRADGLALLRRVREVDASIPVIMITGESDVVAAVEAVRHGAYDYIATPVAQEVLTRVVDRASERKHLLDENRRLEAENRVYQADWKKCMAELASVNEELKSFTYAVSHDLRAPLRHIDGFSRLLLADYEDHLEGVGQNYLRYVRVASQRMKRLIDELLKLSRLTRREMRRERVALSVLARDIAAKLRATQPGREVEFVIEPGLVAEGDAYLLRVVLENLLGNAWKFTSERACARIEFGYTIADARPAYFVRDDGVGFDMAYADKLFSAFQRLHATTEFEGLGMGLAIVQRIVRRHGGQVWAEGAVEQGATFYFTL